LPGSPRVGMLFIPTRRNIEMYTLLPRWNNLLTAYRIYQYQPTDFHALPRSTA